MASTNYKLGLGILEMGAIANDGGMGTVLIPIGDTVVGSAKMTQADDTTTDFSTEESDSPVLSIISAAGKLTFSSSTYNNNADNLVRLFGGSKTTGLAGLIATLGTITPGSSYTSGSYSNIPLTGGAGNGATADIVVAGGIITGVTLKLAGNGYAVGNTLSALAANIGGTGTGFSIPVSAIATSGDVWNAPDTNLAQEQSLKVAFKQGGYMIIPRGKVTAKPNFQFNKTGMSQIDITVDVLQPTKTGIARYSLVSD